MPRAPRSGGDAVDSAAGRDRRRDGGARRIGFCVGVVWQDDAAGRSATKANAPAAEWNIPQPKPADLGADAKIVLSKQPFGAAGERVVTNGPTGGAGAGNPLPTQWRITGIVTTEASRYVVVLLRPPGQNMDRTELRQVGDSLPDGGVVRSVDAGSVTVDREGTLVTVRMFEKN